jgi:transcriptional regulator with XRE-family HTH domain
MQLANRIRSIREAHHLTQSEVAFKCNISPSAYGQIERKASKCSFETLLKISDALGVSVSFLVDLKSNDFTETKNKL